MDHVTVVIPTRNRLAKIRRTIGTIPDVPWIDVLVACDGDPHAYSDLVKSPPHPSMTVVLQAKHLGSVATRNAVIPGCKDGVLYGVDDIDFIPGSLEAAFLAFNGHFPDDDGVVGFCQTGIHAWHKTGVALVGKKWLDRYPGRRLFCPDYYHFAAQEIAWLADKTKRFHQCKEAQITHFNPCFDTAHMDQTHTEARARGKADRALRNTRKKAGIIWGDA